MSFIFRLLLQYYVSQVPEPTFRPKITILEDGFVIEDKKIVFEDVISVYYLNTPAAHQAFPLGSGIYEILTTDGLICISGKFDELADNFSKFLEVESRFEDSRIGAVLRWKKSGSIYAHTSIRDRLSRLFLERFAKQQLPFQWFWIVVGVFFLLMLLVVVFIALMAFI